MNEENQAENSVYNTSLSTDSVLSDDLRDLQVSPIDPGQLLNSDFLLN